MNNKEKKKLLYESSPEAMKMRHDIYVALLHRYFRGTATDKERQVIEEWNAEYSWKRNPKRIIVWRNHAAIAALCLLVLTLGGYMYLLSNPPMSEPQTLVANRTIYETGIHEKKQINLSDGSIVRLNKGSRLHLLTNEFNRKQREVWLEGEAFFEITRNPVKEFIVHSRKLKTVVKGTSFNIKAYSDWKEDAVTVRSGKVEIFTDNKSLAMLTPNQQLMYNQEKDSYEIEAVDWRNATGWMGWLVLNYADVEELKLHLKQYYGVEMEIRNEALKGIHLKSSFVEGTSLEDVMNTLCGLYHVRYTIEHDRVILYK